MENTIQDQLAHQQEMLRDLQAQLADATDEEKKKSLRLKMNVTNAKIANAINNILSMFNHLPITIPYLYFNI